MALILWLHYIPWTVLQEMRAYFAAQTNFVADIQAWD